MKKIEMILIWVSLSFIPIFFQIIYINTQDIYYGAIPIFYPLLYLLVILLSENEKKEDRE